jgi:hypothetical protein
MTARRRARWGAAILLASAAAEAVACNALNGGHDRFLDPPDGSPSSNAKRDGGDAAFDADDGERVEAGTDADAGPIEIPVSKQFTTLNGATFLTNADGTTITAFDAGATHPVIVPVPQPEVPSEDYTLLATVKAPQNGEFGVLIRVQPAGNGVVFGSKFGGENRPFIGTISPPDWNPSNDARGVTYTFTANARYNFKLRAVANMISAKMWDATTPEPPQFQVLLASSLATGRGVGFYTYDINGAILESMTVTVP